MLPKLFPALVAARDMQATLIGPNAISVLLVSLLKTPQTLAKSVQKVKRRTHNILLAFQFAMREHTWIVSKMLVLRINVLIN